MAYNLMRSVHRSQSQEMAVSNKELVDVKDAGHEDLNRIVGSSVGLTSQSMVSLPINESTQVKDGSPGHTYAASKACRIPELLMELKNLREINSRNEKTIDDLKWLLNERKAHHEEVTNTLREELNVKDDEICRLLEVYGFALEKLTDEVAKLSGLVKFNVHKPNGKDAYKEILRRMTWELNVKDDQIEQMNEKHGRAIEELTSQVAMLVHLIKHKQ